MHDGRRRKAIGGACGDKNNSERQREDVASVKLNLNAAQRKRRHVFLHKGCLTVLMLSDRGGH